MSNPGENLDPVALQRLEERKFMHDLAGPLGAALLSIEVTLETAREKGDTETIANLETVNRAIDEVTKMLRARREVLINASKPEAKVGA